MSCLAHRYFNVVSMVAFYFISIYFMQINWKSIVSRTAVCLVIWFWLALCCLSRNLGVKMTEVMAEFWNCVTLVFLLLAADSEEIYHHMHSHRIFENNVSGMFSTWTGVKRNKINCLIQMSMHENRRDSSYYLKNFFPKGVSWVKAPFYHVRNVCLSRSLEKLCDGVRLP